MTRSVTLPPIRIAPESKARLQAVLRDGGSLAHFFKSAVCNEAEFLAKKNAPLRRAEAAMSQDVLLLAVCDQHDLDYR